MMKNTETLVDKAINTISANSVKKFVWAIV